MSVLSDPPGEPVEPAAAQPRLSSRDDLLAMSKAANDRATTHIEELFKNSISRKLEPGARS